MQKRSLLEPDVSEYAQSHSPIGYAKLEITLDDFGRSVDCKFIEVNRGFEHFFHLTEGSLYHKNKSAVSLPLLERGGMDRWHHYFNDVAFDGAALQKKLPFNTASDIWLQGFMVQHGQFMITLTRTKRNESDALTPQHRLTPLDDQLRGIVNALQGVVWEVELDSMEYLYISENVTDIFGYSIEEWMSSHSFWQDHIHPEDRDEAIRFCKKYTSEGKAHQFDFRFYRKDGQVIWVREYVSVIPDSNNQPTRLVGISVDISDQMIVRSRLNYSEDKYKTLVEVAGDAIYLINKEGIILESNHACTRQVGYSREELLGASMGLVDKGFDDPEVFSRLMQDYSGHSHVTFERIHTTKEGKELSVEINMGRSDEFGQTFCVVRDISEKQNILNELVRNEAKYRGLINMAGDPIFVMTEDGIIQDANRAASSMTGYDRGELIGAYIGMIDHEMLVGYFYEFIKDLEPNESVVFERSFKAKNGNKIPVEVSTGRTFIDGVSFSFSIVRDLRQRKREEKIRARLEQRYQNLLKVAPNPIYLIGEHGRIVEANKAAEDMLGYDEGELKNLYVVDMDPNYPKERVEETMDAFEIGKPVFIETQHLKKSGELIPIGVNMVASQVGRDRVVLCIVTDMSERIRQEQLLLEKNKLLAESQRMATLGSWRLLPQENKLEWSDEIYRIFGEIPQAFQPDLETFYDFVHPDERQIVQDHFNHCLEKGTPYHIIHRIITASKQVKFVEENARFSLGENALIEVRGTVQDVTARELAQNELKLSEQNLRRFFENVHVGIIKVALEGNILEVNKEFERITQYNAEELESMTLEQFTPPDYEYQDKINFKMLNKVGRYGPYQKHLITKSGTQVPVLLNGVKTRDFSGEEHVWSIVQDITESEIFKRRLEQDLEKLKIILAGGKLIAMEVDLWTDEVSFLRKHDDLQEDELILSKLNSFDQFLDMIREDHRSLIDRKLMALFEQKVDRIKHDFQLKFHNRYYWYEGLLTVIDLNEDGTPMRLFATLRNIDEEKNNEERQVINQEKERLRISRDIHDSIGQMLVGTRLTLKTGSNPEIILKTVDGLLDSMIKESRLIINNFGISIHQSESLKETFLSLAEKMNKVFNGEIIINWQGYSGMEDLKMATNLFRIYQEAMSNAIKYSETKVIRVNVRNYHMFFMDIIDYGVGFVEDHVDVGFGTNNMRERARELGAVLIIDSSISKGTRVGVRFTHF